MPSPARGRSFWRSLWQAFWWSPDPKPCAPTSPPRGRTPHLEEFEKRLAAGALTGAVSPFGDTTQVSRPSGSMRIIDTSPADTSDAANASPPRAVGVHSPNDEGTPEHVALFESVATAQLVSPAVAASTLFVLYEDPLPDPFTAPVPPPATPASSPPAPADATNPLAGSGGSGSLATTPAAPPGPGTPPAGPTNPPPVAPPPGTPFAQDKVYTLDNRAPYHVDAVGGLLANDGLIPGAGASTQMVTTTSHGTLAVAGDGSFTYAANAGFAGVDSFTFVVDAGGLTSNIATVTLNVANVPNGGGGGTTTTVPKFTWTQPPPVSPTIANPGNQTGLEGQTVSLAIQATGIGPLQYAALELPTGLTIDPNTGIISGTLAPSAGEDLGGQYRTTVVVSGANGGSAEMQFSWAIRPAPPVLANPGNQSNNANDPVSLQLAATDPDGNPLTYAATGLPAGLSLDPASGEISGTVDPSAGSANSVAVMAEDPFTGTYASQTFNWAVAPLPYQAPSMDPIDDQSNAAGDAVDLLLSTTGTNPLTYTATGLPNGLSIDPSSGEITGTLPASAYSPAPYQVSVTASDGTNSAGQSFAWSVSAIQIAAPGDQTGTIGDTVSLPVTGQDAEGGTLSFSATGLPPGLSMDPTGLITGTIAADPTGQSLYTPEISATDGTASADRSFVWAVSAPPTIPMTGTMTGVYSLTAGPVGVTAMEGQTTPAFTVGTFTTSGVSTNPDDYQFSASINWGDGTSGGGVVSGQDGSFTVTGDHTYLASGSFAVAVTVKAASGSSLTMSGIAFVSPATVSPINGLQEPVLVGQTGGTVAEFRYGNPTASAGAFSAQIDPGDGSAPVAGVVAALGHGLFSVGMPYAYQHSGSETARVVLTDPHGSLTGMTTTMEVGDLTVGLASTLTVATMDVGDPSAQASDYVATIDWGDGSPASTGTVTGTGGRFTVQRGHTYGVDSIDALYGAYVVNVILSKAGEIVPLIASNGVVVTRPATATQSSDVPVGKGGVFSGIVAAFEESDLADTPAEFAASIDWGDGTTGTGTVTGENGLFQVSGSHTYAAPGEYHARVDVSQAWGEKKRFQSSPFDPVDPLRPGDQNAPIGPFFTRSGWPFNTAPFGFSWPPQPVSPISPAFAPSSFYSKVSASVTVQFAPSNLSYLPGKDPNVLWTKAFLKEFAKLSATPPNSNLELPETRLANMINKAATAASKDLRSEVGSVFDFVDDIGKWTQDNQVASGFLATGLLGGAALGAYKDKDFLAGYRLQPTWLKTPTFPLVGHPQSLVGPVRLEVSFTPSFYTGSLHPDSGFLPLSITGYGGAFKGSISSGTRWKFGVTGDANWIDKGTKAGLKYNLGATGEFKY